MLFFLGNSPASEFYMPTFRNTLSVQSSQAGRCRMTRLEKCQGIHKGKGCFEVSHPRCVDELYNHKICVTCVVRTQLYIFTQNSTCFGPVFWPSSGSTANLTSSYTICAWGALGRTRSRFTLPTTVRRDLVPPKYPRHILYSCLLILQYNLTKANTQGRNMQLYTQCIILCENIQLCSDRTFNPLKPELNPICYLLALLAHHFLHVSRIRVKSLTLR